MECGGKQQDEPVTAASSPHRLTLSGMFLLHNNYAVQRSHDIPVEIRVARVNTPIVIDMEFVFVGAGFQRYHALIKTIAVLIGQSFLLMIPVIKITGDINLAFRFDLNLKFNMFPFNVCFFCRR